MVLFIIWLIIFSLFIYKNSFFHPGIMSRKLSLVTFFLKVSVGFIIYAIYEFYYQSRVTSDVFRFFDDGCLLYEIFHKRPLDFLRVITGFYENNSALNVELRSLNAWFTPYDSNNIYNDTRTVIRLNAICAVISGKNYHVHSLIFNFLSYSGLILLYRGLLRIINKPMILYCGVFLLPGVLFWGSGPLKESILIAGLGLFYYGIFRLYKKEKFFDSLIFLVIGAFLLFLSKSYLIICLFPGAFFILTYRFFPLRPIVSAIIIHILFIVISFNAYRILPQFDLTEIISRKQRDFINVAHDWKAGSAIEITRIENNGSSLLKNLPEALVNVLIRPFPWEMKKIMMFPAFLENMVFLFLFISALLRFRIPDKETQVLLIFFGSFILLLASLTGLVTPVLGAIVRYKIPFLPFLFLSLILLGDFNKLEAGIGKILGLLRLKKIK